MANGRAKTECSNLIISSVSSNRRRAILEGKLPFYPCLGPWYSEPVRWSRLLMLEAFALSDKGCVRSNNEDYCLIDVDRGLYVLADGMGGARAGEEASRMAV